MTEEQWENGTDPAKMLSWLLDTNQAETYPLPVYEIGDRRLRLFACACVRQVWDELEDSGSWEDVELAERYADGEATLQDLGGRRGEVYAASWCRIPDAASAARQVSSRLLSPASAVRVPAETQCKILRDIVGNPFQPRLNLVMDGGRWWTDYRTMAQKEVLWLTPNVLSLAHAAYDNRHEDGRLDPERLLILSDALEEAGMPTTVLCQACKGNGTVGRYQCGRCASHPAGMQGIDSFMHPVLAHLRSKGPHYRGMWSLDLILSKE